MFQDAQKYVGARVGELPSMCLIRLPSIFEAWVQGFPAPSDRQVSMAFRAEVDFTYGYDPRADRSCLGVAG